MDAILVPFITSNPFSIMIILGVLKIIAKATPYAVDDKIISLLTGAFSNTSK